MTVDNYEHFEQWSDAELKIERAHDFYDNGRWQDALTELQSAIEINPSNSNWHFNKGLTLDTLERFHEAIDAYKQAHELDPHDPEVLNCLAVDYTRVGQYDLALTAFDKLQDTAPDFEPGYCNRIITYAELGRHEDAEQMFYLARQLKEHCPLCYYNIGNSLFSRQKYDRAIWCWQQTRNLDPNHPQIEYRIAQAYWAKGNNQKAKEHFLAALRQQPGDLDILLDAGILLLEMNQLDRAKEKFHRILELDPDQPQAHHYLGELYMHNGRLARAVEQFHHAVKLNPQQNGSYFRLAQCYMQLGQLANARRNLLQEIKLSPDHPSVLLELGSILEEIGDTTEAMSCFEHVIELSPDDPRGFHNLSLCYYHTGLIDEGIELSLQVLNLEPNHMLALHNLALAYRKKRDYEKARNFVQIALQTAPQDTQILKLKRNISLLKIADLFIQPCRRAVNHFTNQSR